jgi:hypothetical protein
MADGSVGVLTNDEAASAESSLPPVASYLVQRRKSWIAEQLDQLGCLPTAENRVFEFGLNRTENAVLLYLPGRLEQETIDRLARCSDLRGALKRISDAPSDSPI